MNASQKAYFQMHVAVFLFGFTAILGNDQLISLSALMTVWWRVLITSVSLLFLIRFGKNLKKIPLRYIFQYMIIGILIAVHWVCFFGSVKLASSSIALVTMATTSFFTALLEPFFFEKKIEKREVMLGLLVVPGMALVVNFAGPEMNWGIIVGILAALLAAVFSVWNKKIIDQAEPMSITFLELGSGWIFLSLVLPFFFYQNEHAVFFPQKMDWVYLLILALACTTLAQVLMLRALKFISAFTSTLSMNLEPVYGILLAYFLLDEKFSAGFYWGVLIILVSVFSYPFLKKN